MQPVPALSPAASSDVLFERFKITDRPDHLVGLNQKPTGHLSAQLLSFFETDEYRAANRADRQTFRGVAQTISPTHSMSCAVFSL